LTEKRETVTWQIRNDPHEGRWLLTLTIAGRAYDIAHVEALDFEAAAKALATQLELTINSWRAHMDE
jgi:hypothetical protein